MISYQFENTSVKFSKLELKRWIKDLILSENKVLGDIVLVFCDDSYILDVNRQYLDHDYFTDIITFDYCVDKLISGDLIISVDTVKSNAVLNSVDFMNELYRVIFHGVLHLCGYKDKSPSDKNLMTEKENFYLNKYII